jgi:hypothetical protein
MKRDPVKSMIRLIVKVQKKHGRPNMMIMDPRYYRILRIARLMQPYKPLGRLA